MPTCRICLRTFKSLRFQTEHIGICTRCVNTLNNSAEPAKNAEARLAEKLANGMRRNAERDLQAAEEWKRQRAQRILSDLDSAVAAKLHDWITALLKKPENSGFDFKLMRAYRRGMLLYDGFADYKENWEKVARRIRYRDGYRCMTCRATDTTLDVHHILYLSRHGTNQQNNLVTLCRKCHEAEHGRKFDWVESKDAESVYPMSQPPVVLPVAPIIATAPSASLLHATEDLSRKQSKPQWAATKIDLSQAQLITAPALSILEQTASVEADPQKTISPLQSKQRTFSCFQQISISLLSSVFAAILALVIVIFLIP